MNNKLIAWLAGILVLAAVVAGFFAVGSPAHQRDLNFDLKRVQGLQEIQSQIISYWQRKNVLPPNLMSLTDDIIGYKAATDPETQAPYEYRVKSDLTFELCADFKLASPSNNKPVPMYYPNVSADNWDHTAGHNCFLRSIDPEIYKNINNSPLPYK